MTRNLRQALVVPAAVLATGCGDDLHWWVNWSSMTPQSAEPGTTWARAWEHDDGTRTVRFGGCTAPEDGGCPECLDVVLHGFDGRPLVSLLDDVPRMTVVHGQVGEAYHGPTTLACTGARLGFASSAGATAPEAVTGAFVVEFDDASGRSLSGALRGNVGATDAAFGTPLPVIDGRFRFSAIDVEPGGPPSEEALWSL